MSIYFANDKKMWISLCAGLKDEGKMEARYEIAARMLKEGFARTEIIRLTRLAFEDIDYVIGCEIRKRTNAYERANGRAEGIKDATRRMLEKGYALEEVSSLTGLTLDEIGKISAHEEDEDEED